ncbi:MAG TPA: SAM-dependent methyltransferase [Acidimicrobiia bacterium]|jgi:hypothetical protein
MADPPPDPGVVRDSLGEMAREGYYNEHSLAQRTAGGLGIPLLERAVAAVPAAVAHLPVIVADLGAAGGRNELGPMNVVIEGLRARGFDGPVVVVHTDIPGNDFTALFENIAQNPETYLRAPDVYAFAAGRSFYERIFPGASVAVGWSAIAVHWLSSVPAPIPEHVYCAFAEGDARDALARRSEADWAAFLGARAAELIPGGQIVVVGGAASDDGTSGAEALMDALNVAVREAVASGRLAAAEYERMTIPTWNRSLADFTAPFSSQGVASRAGLTLEEHSLEELPDQYLAQLHVSGDAGAFADAVTAFLRAFTQPSLFAGIDRPPDEVAAIEDAVYGSVRQRVVADADAFETRWRVAALRIGRR